MAIIRSIQQLERLRDDWNTLANSCGHALLRHEWIFSAARTLYGSQELAVVVRTQSGRLMAAAPLAPRHVAGIERLELLGSSVLHEPSGFLSANGGAERELVDEIIGMRRALVLQRLIAMGDPTALTTAGKDGGLLHSKPGPPSLLLRLPENGANLLDRLPGKLRYDIRRARTRAADRGEVRVDVMSPEPADADDVLRRFMEVEAACWKGRRGSAIQSNSRLRPFFESYCRLASAAGILRMFFLRIGNSMAAAQMAVEAYGRLWAIKIGYDEGMARCSPGFLLTAEAIAYAAQRGLQGYEFLGAPEAWEWRWRPEPRETTLLVFYPRSLSGYAGAAIDVAAAAWRRLIPARRRVQVR